MKESDSLLLGKYSHYLHVTELTIPMDAFPRAALTKYRRLDGLSKQIVIFFQFWRLEVQNQGISKTMMSLKSPENDSLLCLLVSGGWWLLFAFLGLSNFYLSHHVSVHFIYWYIPCESVYPNFLLIRTAIIRLRPL